MTKIQQQTVELHEARGYKVVAEIGKCSILENEREGTFIKVDDEGFVVPFEPIFG
mgnify:FL=1|jgi:hypothetical protein|nr:MAG TPA: hypothetical protein [Caudoviricetes sp.]